MIKPFDEPILVTRPYLPDLERYQAGISEIWSNRWLTNNGPVLQRYEKNLQNHFGTPNVCAFNNGTLALQIALQGMKIEGEVITTPFTFVATAHCLVWNNVKPVFVDIDRQTYTIDPDAVEAAITSRTSAILAVHVFGTPCHLTRLQQIAQHHHLALIYDAAHAFGVRVYNPASGSMHSIGLAGDCSMFSLHSTKLYHSIEGGLLTFNDAKYKKIFEYLRNFGFENETEVMMVGTNAKMNEMQALMGNLILPDLPKIIDKRKTLTQAYVEGLKTVKGIDSHLICQALAVDQQVQHRENHFSSQFLYTPNFAYVPIEVTAEYGLTRDQLYEKLKTFNVFARRYFYPLLTEFLCYKESPHVDLHVLTNAHVVANRILTLPIYFDLNLDDVRRICEIIRFLKG